MSVPFWTKRLRETNLERTICGVQASSGTTRVLVHAGRLFLFRVLKLRKREAA